MTTIHSDDDSGAMPGSPPDLSMASSKSSKSSSFHSSYQSDDNGILTDVAHFEDIGLDDDATVEAEANNFVEELPKSYNATYISDLRTGKRAPPRSKSMMVIRERELMGAKARPSFPSLRGHVRSVTTGPHGPAVRSAPTLPHRGFTSPSTPSLGLGLRQRSASPSLSPHSLPNSKYLASPRMRRGSWQSNRERKSAHELERECDEDDGDDVPDDYLLDNVPMSPRPPHERTFSAPPSPDRPDRPDRLPRREKERVKSVGNGTPPTSIEQGSLKSPSSPKPPPPNRAVSMGQFPINHDLNRPPRAKSWTLALNDLSEEAKALTEALEAHADEKQQYLNQRHSNPNPPSEKKLRTRSSAAELPPLRKNNVMIDPLPISKEKEAVLSRTRPSWLPPKDPLEEKRHLKEYQRMMAAALEADRKRIAERRERMTIRDDTASSLLRIWEEHVLPNWDAVTNQKRTRELWWRGIAPRSRGTVWQRAVGNQLTLSDASFQAALRRAKDVEKKIASGYGSADDTRKGEWFKAIRKDVFNTYPELKIFQPGGPLHESLVDVLMAYVVYRSDVGYVDGLNTTTALLLLNLPNASATFTTLANVLNRSLPLSFHTRDFGAMARIHNLVLETLATKFPRLYNHLSASHNDIRFDIQPDVYLNPIFSGLFTRNLDLDAVTRLWDVWVFEGDAVLVRAMVAFLGCAESKLYGAKTSQEVTSVLNEVLETGGEEGWMRAVRDAGRDRAQTSETSSPSSS